MQVTISITSDELESYISTRRYANRDYDTQGFISLMQHEISLALNIPFGDVRIDAGIATMTKNQRQVVIDEIKHELNYEFRLNAIRLMRKYTECSLLDAVHFVDTPALWDEFVANGKISAWSNVETKPKENP